MKIRWTLIVCLVLMTSCGKEIPDDIIQPEMMENVLYDYHLSISMAQSSKNTEREAQKNYIFKKHHITEELFDSSMVWYTRESKELMTIYENLDRRFKREYAQLERMLDSRDETTVRASISGDSVDIWRKGNIHWLSKTPFNRQLLFDMKADTTFYAKDAFLWEMDYQFFTEGKVVMGMNVVYTNDSVIGMTHVVDSTGSQSIFLHTDSTYQIKELNGFIHLMDDPACTNPKILVHDVSLTRYHWKEALDSLSATHQHIKEEPKKEAIKSQPTEKKKKSRTERIQKMEVRE